jgi:methyl-accepting chemotaxis protein
MSKRDKMREALAANLPVRPEKKLESKQEDIIHDTETDVNLVRETLKDLIGKSTEALEHLSVIAQETEHPRAFEVLSNMIKQTGDLTGELLDVQKKRKDITQGKDAMSNTTTNNAIFVGSTQELQKALRQTKKAIDVTTED